MTELLPEFSTLRARGVFDGELVAFGGDGKPSFRRICRRMLEGDAEREAAIRKRQRPPRLTIYMLTTSH